MSKEKTESREKMYNESDIESDPEQKEKNMDGRSDLEEPETTEDKELAQLVLDQQEQLAELEKKITELRESNLRKKAELENMKKRMQRERVQIFETSKAAAVEHFLPVNDDLQRTIEALENTEKEGKTDAAGIEDGVRMIYNKFQEALKKYNVEKIDQTGVPFNVDIHDALMRQQPEDENIESDIVLQVLENGYRMGERTIRHAKVIVSE